MKQKIQFIVFCFFLSGCATARHSIPEPLLYKAKISGMSDIRAFEGIPSDSFKKDFMVLLEEEFGEGFLIADSKEVHKYSMLAISGGGSNGAYCARVLS